MCDVIALTSAPNPGLWLGDLAVVTSCTNFVCDTGNKKSFSDISAIEINEKNGKSSEKVTEDLLLYGPGFVQRLRQHYLRLAVVGDSYGSSTSKIQCKRRTAYNRRTASCDELSTSFEGRLDDILSDCDDDNDEKATKCSSEVWATTTTASSKTKVNKSAKHCRPASDLFNKPSRSIAQLKERFELKSSSCSSDSKIFRSNLSTSIRNDKNGFFRTENSANCEANELEFIKMAKSLKHVESMCWNSQKKFDKVNSHKVKGSSLRSPPLSESSLLKNGLHKEHVNSIGLHKPRPAARSIASVKSNALAALDAKPGAFVTVASYDDPASPPFRLSVDCTDRSAVHSSLPYDSMNGRGVSSRLAEQSPLSDGENGDESPSSSVVRFEFVGSSVISSKSNLVLSNGSKKNSPLNLAFDSNFPVVYAYVDEEEADDWGPGVNLHFVDYKALCLRLKREKLVMDRASLTLRNDRLTDNIQQLS